LTASPEFLFGNINSLEKSGLCLGLTMDYTITRHWKVRTGLLYSYNTVDISGNDYDNFTPSPKLPSYTTIELKNVNGYVDLLEIPVLLRYTINPSKKVMFNISAGLSSTFS